ncbi:hypothetical protein GUITHDRAFT_148464 [Guillardia theta CCMP2712]|uniref:R3H domain-containing protein n=1 Tax=Guillardia theta (strain CCMP2712) TaxID=905079 RepID=L1I8T5_GUITC|nr:hypothetical protein GUITHDRAFT_148464 [Guillardia theta CCMP2712]EKX32681.1 hypothetical protein GUITHDRAFT_148464 [Guillardia theta CCMP2712]|eukprot:XP_005819661.1 hypothetical protein GUITHDRAFT_148464 [Guillardia theta CCMP2712]
MAGGGHERWWESLREEEDMISLEPLCLLPYEPFELPADENVQTMRWFDGKVLANYLLSTLNFKHPANRRDLCREECVRLDDYLARLKLDEPRVTRAFDLRADILAQRASEEQREAARRMQHDARSILSSFYGSTSYRSHRGRQRVQHFDVENQDAGQRVIDDDEEGQPDRQKGSVAREDMEKLLLWFNAATHASADALSLKFPPALSNHERMLVHKFSEANGLFSASDGLTSTSYGKERFIKILGRRRQNEQCATALSSKEKKIVDQLTLWANRESQELRGISRNSVAEMIQQNSLHPELRKIKAKHERAALLCEAIHRKKLEMAETMLREDPSLAECACSETGEIPYHAAMATGLLPLVKLMKQLLNESAVEEKEPAHDSRFCYALISLPHLTRQLDYLLKP